MKKSTFLLIALAAVALQTTSADNSPNVSVGSGSIIGGTIGDIRLIDAAEISVQEAQAFAQSVGLDVSDLVQQIVSDFVATVQAVRDNVVEQIQTTENGIKRLVLYEIRNQLALIDSSAQTLQDFVDSVRDKLSEEILQQEQNILAQWNNWASNKLDNAAEQTGNNQKVLQQVQNVVNEFINRYSNSINSCADQIEIDLQNYETQVQNIVAAYQSIVQQLIQQVDDCMAAEDGIVAGLQCQRDARQILRQLRRVPSDFNRLIVQGTEVIGANFARNICVVRTLAQWKLESYAVDRKINRIIIADVGASNESASNSASVSNSESNSNSNSVSNSVSDSVSDSVEN